MDPAVPRLPPGQRRVQTWPVLSIDRIPHFDGKTWDVTVEGEVELPRKFSWAEITSNELREEDTSDFHCVTDWSRFDNHWAGVSVRRIAEMVKPKPTAKFVEFWTLHNPRSPEDYMSSMTIENALKPHVMMVYEWEGKPLPPDHGGPLRLITPHLYAWKGPKWLSRIAFKKDENYGFWEKRGYHQDADPWKEQRTWGF